MRTDLRLYNTGRALGSLVTILLLCAPFLLGAQATPTCAGSAEKPAPAADYEFADAVFIGDVLSVAPAPVGEAGPQNSIEFQVDGSWKRVLTGTVTVLTDGGDCALPFAPGARWVVYAYDIDGAFYTPNTSNTSPFEQLSSALDPIREIRPHAGNAVPENFGDVNVIGYILVAYLIFFLLGAGFYYIFKRVRRR